jgi:histidinol dehydrogenase
VKLESLAVTPEEMKEAEAQVPIEFKVAILLAQRNIYTFHKKQKFEGKKVETMEGVTCWQKAVGIEKVGLYVPGGTAPLFSTVLMLAVPAKIAGCKEIVLCTPPNKEGKVNPAILYAAQVAGVSKIFKADSDAKAWNFKGNIFSESFSEKDKGSVKVPYKYQLIPAKQVPTLLSSRSGPTL